MARYTKTEQAEALDQLHALINKGDTLYTVIRSAAKSGMSRTIDVYVIKPQTRNGATTHGLTYLSGYIAKVLDLPRNNDGALKITGCGMDMGYAIVHELSSRMFRNDDGSYSHDGAYSLKHEWI
jgi:hypothetical protein